MANPALVFVAFILFFVGAICMDFPWPSTLLALPPWFISGFLITVCVRQYARDKALERNPGLVEQQGGFLRGALYGLVLWLLACVAGWFVAPWYVFAYSIPAFTILPLVLGTMTWMWRRTGMPVPR